MADQSNFVSKFDEFRWLTVNANNSPVENALRYFLMLFTSDPKAIRYISY